MIHLTAAIFCYDLLRRCCLAALLLAALLPFGGCKAEPPEPTQTKEERRLEEKEMMQREMRNE